MSTWIAAVVLAGVLEAGAESPAAELWHGTPCGESGSNLQRDPRRTAKERANLDAKARADLRRTVWCSSEKPTFGQMADAAAPVLWFSPDEFLLDPHERRESCAWDPIEKNGRKRPAWDGGLPQPFPHDQDQAEEASCKACGGKACRKPGAVYYCARVKGAGKECRPDNEQVPKSGTLLVDYFFYYERDAGLNGHANDIEGAEVLLELREVEKPQPHWRLLVRRVTGEAHGMAASANRLDVAPYRGLSAPDLRVPITLLVEEGKHATCPDRNGDGVYNPGYDVNYRTNDAWGVRDNFSQSVVLRHYDASAAKPRRPSDRSFPVYRWPELATFQALREAYSHGRDASWDCKKPYRLRPVSAVQEDLKGAGAYVQPKQSGKPRAGLADDGVACSEFLTADRLDPLDKRWTFWKRSNERLPLSYRYDGEEGISLVSPLVTPPLLRIVAAPRITLIGGSPAALGLVGARYGSASILFSPSTARWLDWYGAVGHSRVNDDEGLERGHFSWEGGVHVRWKPLWFHNNLPLVGVRVGGRLLDFRRPGRLQLVVEFGSGFL